VRLARLMAFTFSEIPIDVFLPCPNCCSCFEVGGERCQWPDQHRDPQGNATRNTHRTASPRNLLLRADKDLSRCRGIAESHSVIRRLCGRLAILIALSLGAGPAWTAALPGEYRIKAAYLLNFARYVEWPAARLPIGSPLRLCVLGRDPFGGALIGLEGRQVNGHEMRLHQIEGVDQAGGCHLVFIADSEARRFGLLLRGLAGKGVLSVSDADGFAEAGGSIGLVVEDGRVRFDINQATLQRDGLKASSQLLRLGRRVLGVKGF